MRHFLRLRYCFGPLLFALAAAGVLSCGGERDVQPDGVETVQIRDMAGRTVSVPQNVGRVVGTKAGALRLLAYLDAIDMVAGVEESEKNSMLRPYIMAYPGLADLPSIGPQHGGDPELIAACRPDVIFRTSTTTNEADNLQRKTGIPVVVINYGNLTHNRDMLYESFRLIGKILHKEQRAEDLITYIEGVLADLHERAQGAATEETAYIAGVNSRGSHGIASTRPLYDPFLFLDAKNPAATLELEHAYIDKEQLIEWNPDKIFIDAGGLAIVMEELKNEAVLNKHLQAAVNRELYVVMPFNWYTTNFSTVLADAYYIGSVLYPERFSDISSEEKADEIYAALLGTGVYAAMKEAFGGFYKIDDF